MATDHAIFSSSTEVSGTDSDLTKSSSENPFVRRRAQSFGPNVRRAPNRLCPPGNWSRGNTPTPRGSTPTPRSVTPSSLPVPSTRRTAGVKRGELGGGNGSITPTTGHRHVRSRSSLGGSGNGAAAATEEDHTHLKFPRKPGRIRRADSSDVIDGGGNGGGRGISRSRREAHTIGHTQGRRPNSYIINEPTADLNQLAREITSSMGEDSSSLDTPEIKSVSRIHPTVTRTNNYSGKMGVASPGHTPLSSSSGNGRGSLSSTKRSTSSEKLQAAPLGRGTKYNFSSKSTPDSRGRKNSSGSQSRGALNSRSSTPSSGRSTPVGMGEQRRTNRISPPTGESTPTSGGSSRIQGAGLKFLSQRRVIRVREARPVGMFICIYCRVESYLKTHF